MFAIKIIGACLLALAGWYGGVAVCANLTAHRLALGETIALLKTLEEEIAFRHSNLNALHAAMKQKNNYPHLGISSQSFQTLAPPLSFCKEEKTVFSDCFGGIGHTSAAQECERLARYRRQFELFYTSAAQKEAQALAIDRKIGLAIGGMVALMLL